MEKIIIIGSGPAAHTAAIYTARARLEPLMFEGMMAGGIAPGGQLTTTTHIENYPGFPQSITGIELMRRMREQSLACGGRIKTQTVDAIDAQARPFTVSCARESCQAAVLIIATGATARRLHLPGEDRLWQRGISACAVCDGALPIFRDKTLIVVGGGDSAAEEALHLTKYARAVKVIHRRDQLRAAKILQERLVSNEKIEVIWNAVPVAAIGEAFLAGVTIRDVGTHAERTIEASGLFYAIGHQPNTAFLNTQLKLDASGYIVTTPGTTQTSVAGIFACGDVQDPVYRQAVTAAGSGCMAAIEVERYLNAL